MNPNPNITILNLTTLEARRVGGDLLEDFEIFKCFENLDPGTFFESSTAPTRGHFLKQFIPRCC